ncbi:MAG: preprotein translocase subunit SecA, partial [Planctomycetaceae bacterium]|nr:preprotein translocase subunit SecA [Planctomycetaceae bacterium]
HQAVEAKEGLPITAEKLPLAQITRQRFFRMYDGLCGMTGTATGSEAEFATFYGLSVVPIPLRKPSQRRILPARYFASDNAKWEAIAKAVRDCHERGQPVLVGTQTISSSERLSNCLRKVGLEHQLLNGCQSAEEAEIIARAGEPGTVTIATNMAGRGTDIKPSPESLAAGGLHVIVTERQDSSRVDRQLVGRSARQGEPGSAQFFLSAEDDLIDRHQPRLGRVMQKSADSQGEVFLAITSMVDRIQKRIEQAQYQQRRDLFRYDQYREGVLGQIHGSD